MEIKPDKIYLDYAATTPLAPEVMKAMRPFLSERYGNPNSLHSFGQDAAQALDLARETVARAIDAGFREIVFTGSATEANNLALRGVVKKFLSFPSSRLLRRMSETKPVGTAGYSSKHFPEVGVFLPKIIVSAIEHESVLETAKDLERDGLAEVVIIPVDKWGVIDLKKLERALDERTILVSVMYANNEIGTVQPIFEISKIIENFKNRNLKFKISNLKQNILNFENLDLFGNWKLEIRNYAKVIYPFLHCDAVQAFQYLQCDVNHLGVDLMTLSAHKIYGPKGVGALYIRNSKFKALNPKQIQNSKLKIQNKNVSDLGFRISDLPVISPLIMGGGQEFGLRSGTQNVPGIVGFAKAVETVSNFCRGRTSAPARQWRELENKRIRELRRYFWQELKKIYPKAEINGCQMSNVKCQMLPNILNIYFPDNSAEELLIKLDMAGITVSSGAACSARQAKPSHVLQALGLTKKRINESIRFSFGKHIMRDELGKTLKILKKILSH